MFFATIMEEKSLRILPLLCETLLRITVQNDDNNSSCTGVFRAFYLQTKQNCVDVLHSYSNWMCGCVCTSKLIKKLYLLSLIIQTLWCSKIFSQLNTAFSNIKLKVFMRRLKFGLMSNAANTVESQRLYMLLETRIWNKPHTENRHDIPCAERRNESTVWFVVGF